MRREQAFTIIEVLIALSLSSIIIFGMMQAYNNVMRYLNTVQEVQSANRKVCLLFNQMERDFSTAFIPPLLESMSTGTDSNGSPAKDAAVEEKEEPKEEDKNKATDGKEKDESAKKEKLKIYFMANTNENELSKTINEHKTYPFKSVSFINTNPFQIYEQRKARVVRVFYELVIDKARSKGDNLCYNLYRKETEDLNNFKAKENEFDNVKDKKKIVRTHLVADGVKNMFLQYVYQGYKKTDDKKPQKKDVEELVFDSWGEKQETKGVSPCRVEIVVYFWDEKLSKSIAMQATFPVLSFSLVQEDNSRRRNKREKKSDKLQPKAQGDGQ
ncbi:MAG: hypothetical protein US49_C0006G0052 [candidate division TM6 bacterium GW2011_GWF2_37_49]|nr:MAG: hypothetical protein US49_C0006G0052 [candidate division TM6 bacterium GW2011_GWF2_37_49]